MDSLGSTVKKDCERGERLVEAMEKKMESLRNTMVTQGL